MLSLPTRVPLLLFLVTNALGATYSQTDSFVGSSFLNGFSFEAIPDPTHGRVYAFSVPSLCKRPQFPYRNYVDAATASSQNLTFASADRFVVRADFKKVLSPSGPGRNSVRLRSNKRFTTSVSVFNVRHMPQGCGTWPALWTVGSDWPNQGEIDILEGVNDQGVNQATLHTNSGCTMPSSRSQTGTSTGNNCDVAATNNAGCGVRMNDSRSYGPTFNNNGGGWFAMERTSSYIKVWFWSRQATNVPSDVLNGATNINTGNWGTPTAYFPDDSCPISSKFGAHNIIINLTFCGDWAGSVYGSSGCPSSCVDYVNNNPSAFTNAYFDFAWLKVYG